MRWRVIWPDLARTLLPVALADPEPVPLNSCYVLACADAAAMQRAASWLASAPVRLLCRLHADPAANGYARFGARAVGSIPWPAAVRDGDGWDGPSQSASERDRTAWALLGVTEAERRKLGALAAPGR
jgi:hypothetical protein